MSIEVQSFPGVGAFVGPDVDHSDARRVTSIDCVKNAGRLMSQVSRADVWVESRPRVLYYLVLAKTAVRAIEGAIAFLDRRFGVQSESEPSAEPSAEGPAPRFRRSRA